MNNLTKVEDPNRYYNWYHGYTKIVYPYYDKFSNQLRLIVVTSATSGNITTQYFDTKFDVNNVDGFIRIAMYIEVPVNVKGDSNTTIMLNLKKRSMKDVYDKMAFNCHDCYIDDHVTNWNTNITAPDYKYGITLDRRALKEDIRKLNFESMPGFKFTWNYNKPLEPDSKYSNDDLTKEFVR